MNDNPGCAPGECDGDPVYNTPVKLNPYPSNGGGGGGHEFVTELPANPVPGVEYVVMGDVRDCSSFRGSYVWDSTADCWVSTGGAGGGALDDYTFEKTTTGWVAKKNGKVVFTYNDERITKLITDLAALDGRVTTNTTNIAKNATDIAQNKTDIAQNKTDIAQNKADIKSISDDIYGNYLVNRIAVCDDSPLNITVDETNPKAKVIRFCFDTDAVGDKSDGAYEIKGTLSDYLSSTLLGTTYVNIVNVPDLNPDDIVIGETYLYDHNGTMGKVTAYDPDTGMMTVQTMTTSPGSRPGVYLGSVDVTDDLPETCDEIDALHWTTPAVGDFANVRDNNGKLSQFVIQSMNDCQITWVWDHDINAGDYVVDVYTSGGTLIPKNPDGTVTLPEDKGILKIKLHDGTELTVNPADKSVTLPRYIKGAVLADGTVLNVNNADQIVLPELSKLFGVRVHEATGYVELIPDANGKIDLPRYLRGVKDSDGNLLPLDDDDTVTLPAFPDIPEKFNTYVIQTSLKDISDEIDEIVTIPVGQITAIEKKGNTMLTSDFVADVNPSRDVIYVHGMDGSEITQELIAWFIEADDNDNPTEIKVRVLALPRAGGGSGGATDKEVPEYTRDLHAGDEIKKLELITYGNVLYRAKQDVTLTGNWAVDSQYFEEVNSTPTQIYYTNINTGKEVLVLSGVFSNQQFPSMSVMSTMGIEVASGTIPYNGNQITLDGGANGSTYEVLASVNTGQAASYTNKPNLEYQLWDVTHNANIANAKVYMGNDSYNDNGAMLVHVEVPANEQMVVEFRTRNVYDSVVINRLFSHWTIKQVGVVVDPISYMMKDYDEDNPIGSVISFMGNDAPDHYLPCDGAVYPVGSYPEFESFLINQFGRIDYFGGNAADELWAVPDLRGEFLRGAGENGHSGQGSGGVVGDHQNATTIPHILNYPANSCIQARSLGTGAPTLNNADATNPSNYYGNINYTTKNNVSDSLPASYTTRPTNTSVKYCIKVEGTYKVYIQNLAHSVSGTFEPLIPSDTWAVVKLVATEGDTSLVNSAGVYYAPADGYYSISMNTGFTENDDLISFTWQRRADRIYPAGPVEGNKYNLLTGDSFYRQALSGVVYLKAGDPVTLQMDCTKLPTNYNMTWAITMLNGQDSKADIAYAMMHPNLWAPNVEQNFGDGVYGKRITGTAILPLPANSSVAASVFSSGVKSIINCGGWASRGDNYLYVGMNVGAAFQGYQTSVWLNKNGDAELWLCRSTVASANQTNQCPYDAWCLYTK